jgi:hypothetical protein
MDTSALVREGKRLIELMDGAGLSPKAAILVPDSETGTWRIWVVPPKEEYLKISQFNYHGKISSTIVDHQDQFSLLTGGDVDLRSAEHPAIRALAVVVRLDGIGDVHLRAIAINGFFVPDCIVLRMAL